GAATLPLSARRGGPLRNPPRSRGEGEVGAGSGEGGYEGGRRYSCFVLDKPYMAYIVVRAKQMLLSARHTYIDEPEFPVKLQKIPCSQGISARARRRRWGNATDGRRAERDCSSNGAILQRFAAEFLLQIWLSAERIGWIK